jgi:hypothetical protein
LLGLAFSQRAMYFGNQASARLWHVLAIARI